MLRRPSASLIALTLSAHLGLSSAVAAPTVGRVDDPVKVDAKTEKIIDDAVSRRAVAAVVTDD